MLGWIRSALERHRAAMVTAEALVWRWSGRGVQMARQAAHSPHQTDVDRRFWQAVIRVAERRLAEVEGWILRRGTRSAIAGCSDGGASAGLA